MWHGAMIKSMQLFLCDRLLSGAIAGMIAFMLLLGAASGAWPFPPPTYSTLSVPWKA